MTWPTLAALDVANAEAPLATGATRGYIIKATIYGEAPGTFIAQVRAGLAVLSCGAEAQGPYQNDRRDHGVPARRARMALRRRAWRPALGVSVHRRTAS
jgi:hypothetical protein